MTYTILDVKCLDIKHSFKKNVLVPFHIQDRLGAGAPSQALGCRSWAVLAGNTWDAPWPISTKDPFSVGTTNQETPLIFPKGMNRLHEALHCPSPGALTVSYGHTLKDNSDETELLWCKPVKQAASTLQSRLEAIYRFLLKMNFELFALELRPKITPH